MRVGEPGVHGREPRLRAEADEHQGERDAHQPGVERRRPRAQLVPCESARRLTERVARRVIREQQPEERESQADRAEHEVLPCRLERVAAPEERDEEGRRHGRELDRHPHEAEVVEERDREHSCDRELEPEVKPAHLRARDLPRRDGVAHVADRVEPGDR